MFSEACFRLYTGDRYFLSSTVYVFGTAIGSWGCCVFVKSAYPDEIIKSCVYSNDSITPPPKSWWCRVNCGTRVLCGGQLQFVGAVMYGLATTVWIQEDYMYSREHANWVKYTMNLVGICLLISGSYYQLLGQYPESLLRGVEKEKSSLTDLQAAGWCFEILSVSLLLKSAYEYDAAELPDDWTSTLAIFCVSLLMSIGSYFVLSQAYREGTRMDAFLIQKATTVPVVVENVILEQREKISSSISSAVRVPAKQQTPKNPLSAIPDLTDAKTVLRRARKLLSDESLWLPHTRNVWRHTEAHAVRFESNIFASLVDPMLLAAILHSETFKAFQLGMASAAGSSVRVEGKLAGASSLGAVVFRENFSPNPPMPAHESVFASCLNETRTTGHDPQAVAEVLEWCVEGGENKPTTTSSSTCLIKVSPFRYFSISAEGVLKGFFWLEDIARWMPEFLLQAEMTKAPSIVSDIQLFLNQQQQQGGVTAVEKILNMWIWQKAHNSISPLSATVMVRTSPAYRVLLAKHPGLRTRVPDPVHIGAGALRHPLEYFPSQLDGEINVAVATKHGSDFISNEFGSWHLSESDSRQKVGKPKITVWRQEIEGESVKPFRIQARVHGIDPLTLAMLIHRNKLNEILERSCASNNLQKRPSDPLQSSKSGAPGGGESMLVSMIGEDHVTVSNNLLVEFQQGTVRVYRERKRRTKFLPGAREREFTFASVMRDVSPLKAVVVHFGVDYSPAADFVETGAADVVKLRRFNAWALENDGGSDCKVTWAGLLPVGGRMEKVSAFVSSGNDLKQKTKFMEKLVNLFMSDAGGAKQAISETHQYISYFVIRNAIARELRKLSLSYLSKSSDDFKTLLSEIHPVTGGIMGFEEVVSFSCNKRKTAARPQEDEEITQEEDDDKDSIVTMPLSPVESHLRMSAEGDDEQEKRDL